MSDTTTGEVRPSRTLAGTAAPGAEDGSIESGARGLGQRLIGLRQLALLPVIGLTLIIGAQMSSAFLTRQNLLHNVLAAAAVLAVVVVAESMLIVSGHFDLSLESTVGFAPMFALWLVMPATAHGAGTELHPVLGLVVLLLVGATIGLANGLLVARLNLNAFVVTLAMLILVQGFTLGISGGHTLTSLPREFVFLGSTQLLGIPGEVWLAGSIFLGAGLFMRYHVVGREIYAMGGNPDAARAVGVRTKRLTLGLFVTGGILAALAGLLLTARIASVTASQGEGLIFTVFAAAVIGGIDLKGGRGSLAGALTGVLLLAIVQNILVLSNVPSFWVRAIYGAIILTALMLGALSGSHRWADLRRRFARGASGSSTTSAVARR
jgi:simple sugar transport system permease protein